MGFTFSGGMVKDLGRKGRFASPPSLLARIAAGLRKLKVGSHAQPARTREQRKSRAKTNRRNARFAHTERLRADGYKGPNISRSRLIKQLNTVVFYGQVGPSRMVSRAPSVQNIPRREGETRDSVSSVSAPPAT